MSPTAARVAQALGLIRSEAPTQPAPGAGVVPPSRADTGTVTVAEALTLDSVYRAVSILQTMAEQLTVDAWRHGAPMAQPPALITKPDVDSDLDTWLAEVVASLALRGNAYLWLSRDSHGQVINARVLDPLAVHPHRNGAGVLRFGFDGKDYGRDQIAHWRLLILPGPNNLYGLGPIQACARALAGNISRASYADAWFDDSGVPNGVLSTDQPLTDADASAYKNRWQETQHKHETAVLGQGLSYRPMLLNPAEAQWLEAQSFGVVQVARMFGIPPHLMLAQLDGDSRTYANQEQEDIGFVRATLMQYLRKIEAGLTRLLPSTQTARFNVDALLRTDTKTRYEAHEIGLRAKFLTIPEVRAIEGLSPLPAPSTHTIPEVVE